MKSPGQIITKYCSKAAKPFDETGDYQTHHEINHQKPAFYQEYWIIEEKKDYSHLIEELKYQITPAINTDYYLTHLGFCAPLKIFSFPWNRI